MFWHTARDDTMFTSMICISKHKDTQVYGIILPKELTNQAMLEFNAYKIYYAFASGEKLPKPKYVRKKADLDTLPKQKPIQATKGTRLKSKAKVALTEAKQLKLATKRSKKYFHISHASGLGDGVDTQLKVPDEKQQKTSGTDEGTDSDEEDDFDDDSDDNDESDDERTESIRDTQVYGTILPKELTNQATLEFNAYKIYYAFASGEKLLKPKNVRKKADLDTLPK
ncbi:hypothetical protein Tco_0075204 [Tanacetum coccineum]